MARYLEALQNIPDQITEVLKQSEQIKDMLDSAEADSLNQIVDILRSRKV